MSESNQLIEQLLKAEEDAEAIVKAARDNRAKKLKAAHTEAEEEIQQFRKIEQEMFDKELKTKYTENDTDLDIVKENANNEINQVKLQYTKHKDNTIDFIIKAILNVDLNFSEKEKQAIKLQNKINS